MKQERIKYIDVLRVFACYLVIFTHAPLPEIGLEDNLVFTMSRLILASPSSELFLAISGALLLPTYMEMKNFYRKRFTRLVYPVLFWSTIIIILKTLRTDLNIKGAIMEFLLLPIREVTPVYWFIYTISGLYLFAPVISPWLIKSTKREFQFILLLWLITTLMPYINIFIPEFYNVDGDFRFILNYFGGYMGYMLLGVYLRKYPLTMSNRYKLAGVISLLLLIAFLPMPLVYIYRYDLFRTLIFDSLSLYSVIMVIVIFMVMQNIRFNSHFHVAMKRLAKYTFGIYLVHFIVIQDFIWPLFQGSELNAFTETFLISILSFTVSFVIIKLLSLIPKSKLIVGA